MRFTIRLIPVSIYDITKVEAYFAHMASKGFFVKKIRGNFATFEKGIPENTRFRLDLYGKKAQEPPKEMIYYYEEQGWKYICTAGFFHLYQVTRADATEIHTDPVAQGETFVNLNKGLRFYFWLSAILFLLSGGMILYSAFNYYPIYFNVKYNFGFVNLVVIILYIFLILRTLHDYRKIIKLKRQLESGVKIAHNVKYKPSYRQYAILFIPWIFVFIMYCSSYYNKNTNWEESLSAYAGKLPTVSITALETSPDFSVEYGSDFSAEYDNQSATEFVRKDISYISYHWSELAPEAYLIREQGQMERQVGADHAGSYVPSLETEYYRMRFQFLTKVLFQELLHNKINRNHYEKIQYHELTHSKFDEATLVLADDLQLFFARIGEKVVFVQYDGEKDLEMVVDQIYKAIIDFEKA